MNQKLPSEKIRLVLTGGHAGATAYALIEEIRKNKKNWEIYWLGPKKAMEGKESVTFEHKVFPKIGVKYYPVISGRIQRKFTLWTIPSILKIPVGFIQALILLVRIKPRILVSFGGYASFPVVVMGWLLRIPIILHEQTFSFGRAVKLSLPFAKKIALARGESLRFFPKHKSVIIGNPVSYAIRKITPKKNISQPPVIFFVGGSRGSETINDLIKEFLPQLLTKYQIIHQTGELQFKKFADIKTNLDRSQKLRYEVYGFIYPWNMAKFIAKADLIVSRAGANMVAEIVVAKKPAIFIPLPFSFRDEQTQNAQFVAKLGFAKVLNQDSINSEILYHEINQVINNYDNFIKNALKTKSLDQDASRKLLNLINEEIKNQKN